MIRLLQLSTLRTVLILAMLVVGSTGSGLLTQASRAGAATGGTTIVVQTMDSCSQVKGSAVYSLTGAGGSFSATTPAGNGSVSGGGGCPVPHGDCSAGPCVSFTGIPDGTYTLRTTKTPPPNSSNPEGYAPCEGGSACRDQYADVTVAAGGVAATVTNIYPDGKVTTFSFSGTSSDPIVFHDFGLAAPGSGGNGQCDGDSDADDHSTGTPSGDCAFTPETAESSACQPFPWSCALNGNPPPPVAGPHNLGVTFPAAVGAFAPAQVTVEAVQGTAVDPTFRGIVSFSSSSDKLAELPAPYTYTAADNGVHTFTVTFRHPGQQALSVTANQKKVGSAGGVGSVTVSAGNASFVEDLYHDILGRLGTDNEVAYWASQIAGGMTRGAVAAFFSTAPEVDHDLVISDYGLMLGHAPDAQGLAYWQGVLDAGGYDESLLAALAATPDYYAGKGKGTDSGFITGLYKDLLGRTGQASEISAWVGNGITNRAAVAAAFAFSHEHHLGLVSVPTYGWYARYLGRPADPSGAQFWADQLDAGTRDSVGVAAFTGCDEYFAKPVVY